MSGNPKGASAPDKKKRRGRRRRRTQATAPLEKKAVLDLSRPSDEQLSTEELEEVQAHLRFLNRFKRSLRLSLNATEDLLVNGARPPTERGVVKHLFGKVDRQIVDQALARAPLSTDKALRASFLAGVVRLHPTHASLLAYLDAIRETADRRDAVRAFALTVDRMQFGEASNAELAELVALVARTFDGADRTRAYLGLLASKTFRAAWTGTRAEVAPEIAESIAPLEAAYDVVAEEAPLAEEDKARVRLVTRGLDAWLDAPPAILASYPDALRARLAKTALDVASNAPSENLVRLIATLDPKSDVYRDTAMRFASRLARTGQAAQAAKVLKPVAAARPRDTELSRVAEALAWPVVGPLAIEPGRGRLRRAYALKGGWFGWARTAPASDAARLAAETRLNLDLLVPGVATVFEHGLASDGTAYVFSMAEGYPLSDERRAPKLERALARTNLAVRTMRTLSAFGIELPDVDPRRFVVWKDEVALADLHGARASDPERAALANAPHARSIARAILAHEGALRDDLPPELTRRLETNTPLFLLVRTLAEVWASRSDPPRGDA